MNQRNNNLAILDDCLKKIPYQNRTRVENDVKEVMTKLQTLVPRVGVINLTDGKKKQLLQLYGTIPIYFKGAKYNIPMNFFIPETYPQHAPISFVSPTDNMIIKPKHRHVDIQGRCYSPYLSRWNNSCTIYELVNDLSTLFNDDPPVYQKPSSPSTTSTTQMNNNNHNHNPNNNNNNNNSSSSISSGGSGGATANNFTMSSSFYYKPVPSSTGTPTPPTVSPTISPAATTSDRDIVMRKLREKVYRHVKQMQENIGKEEEIASKLTLRGKQLAEEEALVELELPKLNSDLNALKKRESDLDKWIESHEKQEIDVDKMIEPEDMHSRQVLELLAEVSAIEDLIWVLGEALDKKIIDLDTYLTRVRQMARDQFMKKALLTKLSYKL
jgi:ESCRT-I complex subunit TSG101